MLEITHSCSPSLALNGPCGINGSSNINISQLFLVHNIQSGYAVVSSTGNRHLRMLNTTFNFFSNKTTQMISENGAGTSFSYWFIQSSLFVG